MTYANIMSSLSTLSAEQLRAIADEAVRLRRGKLSSRLHVGSRVSFSGRGQHFEGTVTKINQKTATVATKYGDWRVGFGLLTPIS